MSSANVNAAPYTGYSQYTASGAGPPPALSHGYYSEKMGPFAMPPHPHSSSNVATAATPPCRTTLPLSPACSRPTSDLNLGSGSGASGSAEYGVPVGGLSGQTGMIPSNKLMQEAERARQWHASTTGSVAGGPSLYLAFILGLLVSSTHYILYVITI
ncbi:hypothetical protein B0H14DRAFT_2673908 [Mycena olivaceomarginata]|nr:hypothetical protein B0H14DRAFT_2673908 [Mycena olivaceomarginata]